jgi:hypothetical protein
MKQFESLDDYSVDDLIIIVYGDFENWQTEAVEYANYLLSTRGITKEFAVKRLQELEKEYEIQIQNELEERANESYGIIWLILMTLFWPKHILWDWYLKRDGYLRKQKQRLYAIGTGMVLYTILIVNALSSYKTVEQNRIIEINRIAQEDSLRISKIDWSGTYEFKDTTENNFKKVIWKLILEKKNPYHNGMLELINGNQNVRIKCVGLIKGQEIEFYPDTTYYIFDNIVISYYDKIFSFARKENKIITYWGKMKPYYHHKHNDIDLFVDINNRR